MSKIKLNYIYFKALEYIPTPQSGIPPQVEDNIYRPEPRDLIIKYTLTIKTIKINQSKNPLVSHQEINILLKQAVYFF